MKPETIAWGAASFAVIGAILAIMKMWDLAATVWVLAFLLKSLECALWQAIVKVKQ